jgi:hypothetical protein
MICLMVIGSRRGDLWVVLLIRIYLLAANNFLYALRD